MLIKANALKALIVVILVPFLLTGCVFSSVVSKSAEQPTFKLKAVSVKWTANKELRYKVSKTGKALTKEQAKEAAQINLADRIKAAAVFKHLIDEFQTSAPTLVEKDLVEHGVSKGDLDLVELMPIKASYILYGGRAIYIQAKISSRSPGIKPWSAVIRVNGPRETSDKEFAEEFVKALHEELSASGLI